MSIFNILSGNKCFKCGVKLGTVRPVNTIVRISSLPQDPHIWCYTCGVCGRITCYDCSDNTQRCKCGQMQWIDSIIE